MIDALEIGYAIKDKRAALRMTQAQVAKSAGVSERCLWSLELGQNKGVQLDKLTAVLGVLGLELEIKDMGEPRLASPKGATATAPALVVEEHPGTAKALAILTEGKQ